MKLDRELQRQVLTGLANIYPASTYNVASDFGLQSDAITTIANVTYLAEHGLLQGGYRSRGLLNNTGIALEEQFIEHETTITAAGLDFLADDGGIGAILGTLTVRMDATQFTELLARRIEQLPSLSADEKSSIAGELRKLPAKSAEKAIEKLLDWVADHAQDALPLLRSLMQLAG